MAATSSVVREKKASASNFDSREGSLSRPTNRDPIPTIGASDRSVKTVNLATDGRSVLVVPRNRDKLRENQDHPEWCKAPCSAKRTSSKIIVSSDQRNEHGAGAPTFRSGIQEAAEHACIARTIAEIAGSAQAATFAAIDCAAIELLSGSAGSVNDGRTNLPPKEELDRLSVWPKSGRRPAVGPTVYD